MCTSGNMAWVVSRYKAKPIYTEKTLSDDVKTHASKGDERTPLAL